MVDGERTPGDGKGFMKTIPYGHQWIIEEDIKEVVKVLKSDWITQGPKVKGFEDALCRYTGVKYAVVVSSGTAALHIACLAAGIKSGDEAITSPITFVASANCILYCGGKPVFADIQEDTVNIDPEEIKKKITKRTKTMIPVHFAGHPCDLKEIYEIARDNKLIVIEDAAHALGAEYKSSRIGSCKYSDMTIFSFHPVKSITTGEGGAVLTNRKDLYQKLLIFRNHGITKKSSRFSAKSSKLIGGWYHEMQELGFNYRITDIQCALGLSQLKKLDRFIRRRKEIVGIYNQQLSDHLGIDVPIERSYVKSSWHIYPIRLKDTRKRKAVFGKLKRAGIGVQVHYIPVYWQPYYQKLGYKKGICLNAEEFYQAEISIPLYQSMKDKDVKYVADTILKVFKEFM